MLAPGVIRAIQVRARSIDPSERCVRLPDLVARIFHEAIRMT
jgi:hypothetical protein